MARIEYFGRLSDVAGTHAETLPLPAGVSTAEALRNWLDETRGWGGALGHRSVRVAVNDELSPGDADITDLDTIAFLPPVGGG